MATYNVQRNIYIYIIFIQNYHIFIILVIKKYIGRTIDTQFLIIDFENWWILNIGTLIIGWSFFFKILRPFPIFLKGEIVLINAIENQT